jgi:aminoglycoside phosphotransferase (APT) family kinase protein
MSERDAAEEAKAEMDAVLAAAFGDAPRSALVPLAGGMSGAALFTVTVDGKDYVVRRSAKAPPGMTLPPNRVRLAKEYRCLELASAAGIAPRVVHLAIDAGIVVMEKIDGAPLGQSGRSRESGTITQVAQLLRRLHEGAELPPNARVAEMTAMLDGALRAGFGAGLPAALREATEEVAARLLPFDRTAPCHYDGNPNNILVTGARVYLVDWELAGQGDPYLDLAQLGVFLYPEAAQREEMHRAYLGRAPTVAEAARMYLTRVLALGYYACGFHHVMARMGLLGQEIAPADAPTLTQIHAELAQSRERFSPVRFSAALRREMTEMRASPRHAEAVAELTDR